MPEPQDLYARLGAYGADLSRWPTDATLAREALLRDPEFRRAYESERNLDRRLAEHSAALDAEIEHAGALDRVRRFVLARRPADLAAGIPWERVAAAFVVAVMLGGALDLALPQQQPETFDVAIVDPLSVLDDGQ